MVRNKRSEMWFKLCTYPQQNDGQNFAGQSDINVFSLLLLNMNKLSSLLMLFAEISTLHFCYFF